MMIDKQYKMEHIKNAVKVGQQTYYEGENKAINYYYTGSVNSCVVLWLRMDDGKTFFAHLPSAEIVKNKKGSKDMLMGVLEGAGAGIAVFNERHKTTVDTLAFIKGNNIDIAIKESISGADVLIGKDGGLLNFDDYNIEFKIVGSPANDGLEHEYKEIDIILKNKY